MNVVTVLASENAKSVNNIHSIEGREGEREEGGREKMKCTLEMSVAEMVLIFEIASEQYYNNFENPFLPFLLFSSSHPLTPETGVYRESSDQLQVTGELLRPFRPP